MRMSRYEEIKKTIECAKGNCVTRLNFDTTELDYLIDIIKKQREAIKDAMKYAWHLEACMGIEGGTCTCGLDKRLVQWHETLLLTDTE